MKEIRAKLSASANVIQVLGDQLISNDSVALIELIKNSYDAGATDVEIVFKGALKKGSGAIIIKDNGRGMDLKTIKEAWMVVATNFKKIEKKRTKRKRSILGDKGIGRFSASKLAKKLILITRSDKNEEICVQFNWELFTDINKMLDDFEILIQIREPTIFLSSTGTILKLVDLCSDWNKSKVNRITNNLSRLINPVKPIEDFKIKTSFTNNDYREFNRILKPPKSIENPLYKMIGSVDKLGKISYEFNTIKNVPENKKSQKKEVKQSKFKNPIPFDFEFRVWDLSSSSIRNLSQVLDIPMKTIREDIRFVAGISLYRDNFRVLPYGEPNNDWLRLDIRRVNYPTFRLSNNQIVGTVTFREIDAPLLKDQSNRQGLIENNQYEFLKEIIREVLDTLERKRAPLRKKKVSRNFGQIESIGVKELKKSIERKGNSIRSEKARDIVKMIGKKVEFNKIEKLINENSILKKIESKLEKEDQETPTQLKEDLEIVRKLQKETIESLKEIKKIGPLIKDLEKNIEDEIEEKKKTVIREKSLLKKVSADIKHSEKKIKDDFEIIKEDLTIYRRLSTLGLMVDKILHEGNPIIGNINYCTIEIKNILKQENYSKSSVISKIEEINSNLFVLQSYFDRLKPLGGKKSRRLSNLDIRDFFEKILRFWQKELKASEINFILPKKTYLIKIIPSDFLVIITNLMLNSIYWLKQEKNNLTRVIQISLSKENEEVTIIFSDNGPGVDSEDAEDIFLPYISNKDGGIGLGLTIIKETIEAYKGNIKLVDHPLSGANFQIKMRGV